MSLILKEKGKCNILICNEVNSFYLLELFLFLVRVGRNPFFCLFSNVCVLV